MDVVVSAARSYFVAVTKFHRAKSIDRKIEILLLEAARLTSKESHPSLRRRARPMIDQLLAIAQIAYLGEGGDQPSSIDERSADSA